MILNRIYCLFLILVIFLCSSDKLFAKDRIRKVNNELVYDAKEFEEWIIKFRKDAKKEGITEATLNKYLPSLEFVDAVILSDKKSPSKTKNKMKFSKYSRHLFSSKTTKTACHFLHEGTMIEPTTGESIYHGYDKILNKVGGEYNVQPKFIVALLAIESRFGKNTGKHPVLDSVMTLAFEGSREKLFRRELISSLKILQNGYISKNKMLGSWAGAIGQIQFLPTSYLHYGVDYNKDGKIDLWNDMEDIIASAANYLKLHGWDPQVRWGRQVTFTKDFDMSLVNQKTYKTVDEWADIGVLTHRGYPLPKSNTIKGRIISSDHTNRTFYLVYNNFETLLKWNRSEYFALAVSLFSDKMDLLDLCIS